MLLFYYDLVDKFVDRSNYEYCQMDTDSAYIALDSLKITHRRITITKEAILKDQSSWHECEPLGTDIAQEQIDSITTVRES